MRERLFFFFFAAVPLAWSFCIAAPLRAFAPKKLPFDCEMAKLCEEYFQHLVIRWLYSLCVIVASPLWSKVESGCNSISGYAAYSEEEEAAQSEHKENKVMCFCASTHLKTKCLLWPSHDFPEFSLCLLCSTNTCKQRADFWLWFVYKQLFFFFFFP